MRRMKAERREDHLLDRAIEIALEAHRGRVDKAGRPYILHPLRVMAGMTSDEERLTAVLHDVIEDAGVRPADLRKAGMPESVIDAVQLLTRPKGEHDYIEYVASLKHNPLARRVKLADLEDNMDIRRLSQLDRRAVQRLNRYRAAWELLQGEGNDNRDAKGHVPMTIDVVNIDADPENADWLTQPEDLIASGVTDAELRQIAEQDPELPISRRIREYLADADDFLDEEETEEGERPDKESDVVVSRPWPRTFWISPGRLLAGAYPGDLNPSEATRKLNALREVGVRHIVNLTDPKQTGHGRVPFRPYAEEAASLGMAISMRRITDQGVPSGKEMAEILDDIDCALEQDKPVYVHCWGGKGRTGTVVGCWLVRHGASPEGALAELDALHERQPGDPSYPFPENRRQEEFIRTWREEPLPVSDTTSAISLSDRLAGAVWGHLVGDALGVPYEFKSATEIGEVHWGKKGTWSQPSGTWSDDGGLMLALLDSLLDAGFDLDDQGKRSLAWYRTDAYKPGQLFDIGGTTEAALQRIEGGTPSIEAGGAAGHENGNGSLMRVLPIALTGLQLANEDLITRARQASRVTHAHPRAQLTCALYCLVVRSLLQGESDRLAVLTRALALLEGHCYGADRDEFTVIKNYKERTGAIYVVDSFWSAWDSFESAADYEQAVVAAIKLGNDPDTTGCVTGGLAGAYWGLRSIPTAWVRKIRGQEIVEPLVAQLIAG